MKKLVLLAMLASFAPPAFAGGPIIIEDATEEAPAARKRNGALVPILLGVAVAALILGGGSSDCSCNTPDPDPTGSCGC